MIFNFKLQKKNLFNDPRRSFLHFGIARYAKGLNMKKQKDTSKGALVFCITTTKLTLVTLKK